MAKIQIKSEKLTPFGGFFRVMEQFDSTLSSVIDSTLGLRRTAYDGREQYAVVANGSRYLLRYAYLDGTHRHHPACALLARVRQARQV